MIFFKIKWTAFIVVIFTIISCNIEPQKINYGHDHCTFCDMTVVDKTHASEYVTKKGKSYIFDSIECLVQKINESEIELAFILVSDYSNPGELTNAETATFLISKEIKSPMGANLSAFSSKEKAEETQQKFGGEIYTWEQLKNKFRN